MNDMASYRMNPIVTVRSALPTDSEFVYTVRRTAFKEYAEQGAGWDGSEQRTHHERRFATQDFRIVRVGGVGGADVGFVALVVERDRIKLNQLMILPEHQSKGIGWECMALILDESHGAGLPIRLRVMKTNPRARTFWESLGFTAIGETETHVLMEYLA